MGADSFTVTWNPGYRSSFGVSAHAAHTELEEIRKKAGGELFMQDIVDRAKVKRSALHPLFNWDDAEAANEHRLEQARRMVRSLRYHREDHPDKECRRYLVSASDIQPRTRTYQKIEDVLGDPDKRVAYLHQAFGELLAFQRKYRELQELAVVFRAIEEAHSSVGA